MKDPDAFKSLLSAIASEESFEIAQRISWLSNAYGYSGETIAENIGKSPSYVSRRLSAYKSASDELRSLWMSGAVADHVIYELADLTNDEQRARIAAREIPGLVSRPGIDAVKAFLDKLEAAAAAAHDDYVLGARDFGRWVTGRTTSREFAQLVERIEGDEP